MEGGGWGACSKAYHDRRYMMEMVEKSVMRPLGVDTDVMKFSARSMQNRRSMIKSLRKRRLSCTSHATRNTQLEESAPQSPRVRPLRPAVFTAAAKADDDACRQEEEGVEDEEHHEEVPTLRGI